MLSIRRFMSLANRYGADFERWPVEVRAEARALLDASAEARAVLAVVRAEDLAIRTARAREDATLWSPGEQDAALERLRSNVARQITLPPAGRHKRTWLNERLSVVGSWVRPQPGWLGLAGTGGVAMAAGLLIGSLSVPAPAPAPANILAAFQASPLHLVGD